MLGVFSRRTLKDTDFLPDGTLFEKKKKTIIDFQRFFCKYIYFCFTNYEVNDFLRPLNSQLVSGIKLILVRILRKLFL